MVTNVENKINFCRQYFPELKMFLEDFDISDEENGYKNTLSMHILLDAYNGYKLDPKQSEKLSDQAKREKEEEKIKQLREKCRWKLAPVEDSDLMLAIEEFYEITNSLEKREKLIDYLLYPTKDKYYVIDDEISRAIFVYFGFLKPNNNDTIGQQIWHFTTDKDKGILSKLYVATQGEKEFKNCLELFRNVRNLVHQEREFEEHIKDLYHKYLIFTYIGLTYFCRRLWRRYHEKLENPSIMGVKYHRPSAIGEFVMPEESKNFIVRTDRKALDTTIVKVEFKKVDSNEWTSVLVENGSLPSKECRFVIDSIRKYEPFVIRIKYSDGNQCETVEKVPIIPDYYSYWGDFVEIIQPRNVRPFIGIAGGNERVEDEMTILFNKINKLIGTKSDEVKRFMVLGYFSKIVPALRALEDLRKGDLSKKQKKEQEEIQNQLLSSMNELKGKFDDRLSGLSEKMDCLAANQAEKYDDLKSLMEEHLRIDEGNYKILIEIAQKYQSDKEKKDQRRNRNKVIIVTIGVLLLSVLAYSAFFTPIMECFMTPEEVTAKGDELLKEAFEESHSFQEKDKKFDEAAAIYRRAISKYEDILAKDSLNIEANIGLATMLMRGKGCYDLFRAENLAKNAINSNRGEDLYIYLLERNGKFREADNLMRSMDSQAMGDYAKLTNALQTIYGENNRKRTLQNTKEASDIIAELPIQEAKLELAGILKNGIKREKQEDSYYINPDPILSSVYLMNLAIDSLSPISMGALGDFLYQMQEFVPSLNYTYAAWKCGISDAAPIMRIRIMVASKIIQFQENPEVEKVFEEVSREARHKGTIEAALSNYIQEEQNCQKGRISAKQLLESLDSLISLFERDKSDSYQFDFLYRARVSLCLEAGEIERAVKLAMGIDNCQDSTAVSQYLQGICYAKGYGDYEKDSVEGNNLIIDASDRGYLEAVHTRLKLVKPLSHSVTETIEPVPCRWITGSRNVNKAFITSTGEILTLGVAYSIQEGNPLCLTKQDGSKIYLVFNFDISTDAEVPDSLWKQSPQLAMDLAEYWKYYYMPLYPNDFLIDIENPYIPYCPKEYQTMHQTMISCFELIDSEDGDSYLHVKDLPNTILEESLFWLQVRIASSIEKGDAYMAKVLITMWVELAKNVTNNEYFREAIPFYEQFALPEYKDSGKFLEPKFIKPVYAY